MIGTVCMCVMILLCSTDHPAHPVASFKTSPVFSHSVTPLSLPHGSNLTLSTPSRQYNSNPALSTLSYPHNSSLTLSPFNPTLLHTLSQPAATPTSNRDDVLNDSLGMLSTVALYHSELSSINTTSGTPVQERLANMRLASSSSGKYTHVLIFSDVCLLLSVHVQ